MKRGGQMIIFSRRKKRKLIKRFIELDEKCKALEADGCMKRNCSMCYLLTRIDEYHSTCMHKQCGDEMWDIYKKLFPNESPYEYAWSQKVNRVRKMSTS